MNSELILPLVLQLLGVIVIIAEFLIPSAGLLSLLALGLLGWSLFTVFTAVSVKAGFLLLTADLIILPILVIVGLKMIGRSPAALRQTLSRGEGVTSQSATLEHWLGKQGTALCHLRPAGIALLEGKRVDVVSRGEFIDKDSPLIVVAVTANQVIVRKKESEESSQPSE